MAEEEEDKAPNHKAQGARCLQVPEAIRHAVPYETRSVRQLHIYASIISHRHIFTSVYTTTMHALTLPRPFPISSSPSFLFLIPNHSPQNRHIHPTHLTPPHPAPCPPLPPNFFPPIPSSPLHTLRSVRQPRVNFPELLLAPSYSCVRVHG